MSSVRALKYLMSVNLFALLITDIHDAVIRQLPTGVQA